MNHTDYMEHGFCFLWEPGLVWLHVASDILTGLAYFSIAAELERFIYTASHDLKSPLVTISAFLGYLEADINSGGKRASHDS